MAVEVVKYVETGKELNELKVDLSAVKNSTLKDILETKVGERMAKDEIGKDVVKAVTRMDRLVDAFKAKAAESHLTRKMENYFLKDEEAYNKELKSFADSVNELVNAEIEYIDGNIRKFETDRKHILEKIERNDRLNQTADNLVRKEGEDEGHFELRKQNLRNTAERKSSLDDPYVNEQLFRNLKDALVTGETEKFGTVLDDAVNRDLGYFKLQTEAQVKGVDQISREIADKEAAAKKAAEEAAKKAAAEKPEAKGKAETAEGVERRVQEALKNPETPHDRQMREAMGLAREDYLRQYYQRGSERSINALGQGG